MTFVTESVEAMLACDEIYCVIEATGHPLAGTRHALMAIDPGKHPVMVNVEADVMVGPIPAEKTRAKGLVNSKAHGDRPALIHELVDWARATGFEVTAAGKGVSFEPRHRCSAPTPSEASSAGPTSRPPRATSILRCTTPSPTAPRRRSRWRRWRTHGLDCPDGGLAFPQAGLQDLARVVPPGRRRRSHGEVRLVDIAASQEPDGREVFNTIRYGVFVTVKAHNEYAKACFKQYGLLTDPSGRYASMWRPFHVIGLENLDRRALGGPAGRDDQQRKGIPRRRGGPRGRRPSSSPN